MKKFVLVLLLALAPPASLFAATITATATVTTNQESRVSVALGYRNAMACSASGLAVGCTQAQINAVGGRGKVYCTGSPCTTPAVDVYYSAKLTDLLRDDIQAVRGIATETLPADLDLMSGAQRNQVCALRNAVNPATPATGCWP